MTANRRTFMQHSLATMAAACASQGAAGQPAAPAAPTGLPSEVGRKFNADGSPRRFPGNTIISQIPLGTPLSDALVAVRDTLAAHSVSRRLALLPPSSYHMTVFEGVTDNKREADAWPAGLALNAPLATCHQYMEDRLASFAMDGVAPLRMKLDEFSLRRDPGATIRLLPVDDKENRKLRGLRDRLAAQLGMRRPHHDQYGFHISLAYLVDWMSQSEKDAYTKVQSDCFTMLQRRVPLLELDAPAFCTFYDMFAFDSQFRLGQGRQAIKG